MTRIGYLIPEFPGQTHIFFWREMHALAGLGVECRLVSTRKPMRRLISHAWASEAMAKTAYLAPPTPGAMLAGLGAILRGGPAAWARVAGAVVRGEAGGRGGKIRLAGLALVGGQLAAIARRERWTHLHVHSCADATNVAMFAHLVSGLPYSMTLHGPLEDYGPNQPMKWRHAAFAVVITRKLLGEVRAALDGSTPPAIDVAPMGVETDRFRRSKPYAPYTGSGPCRIFACGRLNPCKGHDDLIRATALLRDRGYDVRLTVAGADDSADGSYRTFLEAETAKLGLSDRVTLLGAVAESVVREGLEEAHVFALASLHEPLGVAIMEAMAMEMPVVVTRAGGVPELVDDGADGVLVDPQNPQSVADGIERVLRDPALATRLSAAARKKVETSFQSGESARVIARHVAEKQRV